MKATRAIASQQPQTAISRLFAEHGDRIYRLGLRLCGKPEDAEELVQETFLSAFRNWDQFEGRAKPSTWLYSIAARACGRRKRLRAGEPRTLDSLSNDSAYARMVKTGTESPLETQMRQEVQEVVQNGLATLPFKYRMPLVLKDIAEMSIADVCLVLGLRTATVKTRLHRARLKLRDAIGNPLPTRDPASAPSREICLDLLTAKQEALDRGTELAVPKQEICHRCRHLFAELDLGRNVCRDLDRGTMPEGLRTLIEERLRSS